MIKETLKNSLNELYDQIDTQVSSEWDSHEDCNSCGRCCDFPSFGHHLFVTTPEIVYFADRIGTVRLRKMSNGICPYNVNGKCTVYPYRFSGCRIFSCKGGEDTQQELSEWSIRR